MIDTHIHSTYSVDAKSSIEENIIVAIEKKLNLICFTEHIDMNPNDNGYMYYKENEYFNEIEMLKDKYADKIKVFIGIEFSEPHLYKKEFELVNSKNYDFVLGSVHWIGSNWIGDKKYTEKYSIIDLYSMHYEETLKACNYGGFDALAHIDFPKRYLDEKYEPMDLIDEILKLLVDKEISMEINTSPLRKGYIEYYPSLNILNQYIKYGGVYCTVGSDSHICDDVGTGIEKIINQNIKICYYDKRKRIEIA